MLVDKEIVVIIVNMRLANCPSIPWNLHHLGPQGAKADCGKSDWRPRMTHLTNYTPDDGKALSLSV